MVKRKSVVVVGSLLVVAVGVLAVSSLGAADGRKSAAAKPIVTTTGLPSTSTSLTTPAATVPAIAAAPLTGLPMPDAAARARAALVIKVDNAPEARPQFGIDKADVVYEEKVEGGLSRFMAIFQSQDSSQVGPVRSLRSTDVYALRPLGGALMGFSGGIQPFKNMLPSSNLVDLSQDSHPAAYARMAGRPYVHSLYTSTDKLRASTSAGVPAPTPLFSYLPVGASFGAAGAAPLASVSGNLGPSTQFDWTWDSTTGLWKRGVDGHAHDLVNGQISATNVIIQFVHYRSTPYVDPARNPVDEGVLDGTGDSWVLSQGQIVSGRWVHPDLSQPTVYNDAAGIPIKLTPGNTWVILVPAGNAVAVHA